jgi:Ca-activated chloride channel family protein
MRWADFTYVYGAAGAVVVLAIAFALDFTRRKRLLDKIGHAPQLLRMAQTASPGRRGLKAVLLVVGVALVILTLARLQIEGESKWRQRGIDIALVMDFSRSMLARDVYPSRSERAKLEAEALVNAFGGDRVAVVAFAGATVHYPLTTDYEAAKILFRGLVPGDLGAGSDLGEAVVQARCLLRPDLKDDPDCQRIGGRGEGGDPLSEGEAMIDRQRQREQVELGDRARALVVLTDGEDTEDRARAEVERAAQLGIQVFLVGIGTKTGGRIPELDAEGHETGWKLMPDGKSYVTSRLDEGILKDLAKMGGGEDHYLSADPRHIGVEPLVTALGKLKVGDLQERVVKNYGEAYTWLLLPAFLLLLFEACIAERRKLARAASGKKARA